MTIAAKQPLVSEAGIALLSYCASSIAMTIMNKYVLSGHKFHLNFALLVVQSLVSVVFLHFCKLSKLLNYRPLNQKDAIICTSQAGRLRPVGFPVSLLLVGMIFTGSKR